MLLTAADPLLELEPREVTGDAAACRDEDTSDGDEGETMGAGGAPADTDTSSGREFGGRPVGGSDSSLSGRCQTRIVPSDEPLYRQSPTIWRAQIVYL
jgi:hypothetical protein